MLTWIIVYCQFYLLSLQLCAPFADHVLGIMEEYVPCNSMFLSSRIGLEGLRKSIRLLPKAEGRTMATYVCLLDDGGGSRTGGVAHIL